MNSGVSYRTQPSLDTRAVPLCTPGTYQRSRKNTVKRLVDISLEHAWDIALLSAYGAVGDDEFLAASGPIFIGCSRIQIPSGSFLPGSTNSNGSQLKRLHKNDIVCMDSDNRLLDVICSPFLIDKLADFGAKLYICNTGVAKRRSKSSDDDDDEDDEDDDDDDDEDDDDDDEEEEEEEVEDIQKKKAIELNPYSSESWYNLSRAGGNEHYTADECRERAELLKPPTMPELVATVEREEEAEAQKRAHLEYIAGKDWDRDFGGAFPDLMVGLAEGLAEMKRKKEEEED